MSNPIKTKSFGVLRPPTRLPVCLLMVLALGACATADESAKTVTGTTGSVAQTNISFASAQDYPLLELRTYTTNPGKLDALHRRFRDHTMNLFEKHGAKNVAYWTPTKQANTLIYIIAHKSADARTASWTNFLGDPAWQKAYAASIADGKLVANIDSVLMHSTDYSPSR